MTNYLKAFAAMIAGLLIGFAMTAVSLGLGRGFGALAAGPWTAWPRHGAADIDPYARAMLARTGEAPLGRDQGLAFIARADSSGATLDGRCAYRITDPAPAARYWTLAVATTSGTLIDNPARRYAFTSAEILRREGGGFAIDAAEEAHPGNWLPTRRGPFLLILRLYDTSLDTEVAPDPSTFPKIIKLGCA
ncbi:DUF1214 domain-containing protein [Methylosinus sp. Sm6]|uniref:DUF1214 domain-containing protein n=1 Tax=Methylosinus sp. Sm6 TaxID=2866948 RepID=UPI001C999817|nr:DUF1214 domain-containing protein [Methylosinus sp. Sm6]MBY6239734.1 DUF1214 domain-containing protein [Methylosinus sp. Sm6]